MASVPQDIVDIALIPAAEAPYGERSDTILKGSFPMSPVMYSNDPDILLTDEKLRDKYYDVIKDTEKTRPKMEEVPNMNDVALDSGGEGKHSTGKTLGDPDLEIAPMFWPVPNTNSSYNSNSSPGAAPSYQEASDTIREQSSVNYGSLPPSPESPHSTTSTISDQDFRLGRLTLGSSS